MSEKTDSVMRQTRIWPIPGEKEVFTPRGIMAKIRHLWEKVPSAQETLTFLEELKKRLVTERVELLTLLREKESTVGLVLSNGHYYTGTLEDQLNSGQVRLRLEQTLAQKLKGKERFTAISPRTIRAIKFIVGPNFKEVPFPPYQGSHRPVWFGYPNFSPVEFHLYYEFWDLLNYLWEGKNQRNLEVELCLSAGNQFTGLLEIATPDRVLLALKEKAPEGMVAYLDVHPLDISAISWTIIDGNWPYDPTAC